MAAFPRSNPFDGMDDLSAALAIRLLLEDSEQLSIKSKGKSREGEVSDAELALEYFEEDLGKASVIISDRQMTKSIGIAVQTDGNVLTELLSQEREAGCDREFALRLGGQTVPPRIPWIVSSAERDDELPGELSARFVSSPTPNDESGGPANADSEDESCKPASSGFGPPYRDSKKHRCTACQEYQELLKIARAPCGHEYCEDCLRNLFESSMTDESLFPPRCCKQPIPPGAVRIFLTRELIDQYELKKVEFGTTNRTYCSSLRCSVFLRKEDIEGDRGTCQDCGIVTCTMCKAEAHQGDCPADVNLQLVLATAAENEWQRCYSCRRLVELDTGCNHITYVSPVSQALPGTFSTYPTQLIQNSCNCRAQFCYVCGEQWKTCACPQWNEDRLLSRATQIVDRQPRAPGPPPIEQIAAQVLNLRTRHNCSHDSWRYVRGRHQCEECRHLLPSYIFECNQCRILACNRCRRNRF